MATDATDNAADPGLLDKLSTLYWGNSPNINQQLRQRIALQMMGQGAKKGYPKTIGEGLSAVGDSLGDIGLARMLERSDQAAQRIAPPPAAASTADATPTASASNAMAYEPPPAEAAPVSRSLAAPPAAEGQPADAPGNVMSPAVAPSPAVLAPAMPTGLGGAGPPMTPPQTASLLNPRSTLGGTAPRVPADLQPAAPPDPEQRDRMAATVLAQGDPTARGVQQSDPTLAGAVALPPSPTSTTARGGPQPDQRVAQLAPSNPRTVTDISRAPAPPVPQQPTPIPGYVPPPPGVPTGAPVIGMTPREIQLRQWLAANQGNPYAAMKVAPELSQLELARTTRQNEASELYKAQILRDTEQAKQNIAGRMDQAKRIADVEQTRVKTQAERLQDTEGKYVLNPDGTYSPPRIIGVDPNAPPNVKLSEDQRKSLTFYNWAKLGEDAMKGKEQMLAHGFQQEALGKIPFDGNAAQNADYRAAKNGANNFVLAFMRSTSGAAYGVKEAEDHARAMLPKYGDDPQTLANKAEQRQAFIDATYGGLGPGRQLADYYNRQRAANVGENSKGQRLIDIEMENVKPAGFGDVKKNRKTGATRIWNGSHWVEE